MYSPVAEQQPAVVHSSPACWQLQLPLIALHAYLLHVLNMYTVLAYLDFKAQSLQMLHRLHYHKPCTHTARVHDSL
jgi:hypothetical protein